MSKKNRKAMYDTLVKNQRLGRTPNLSQDDGALVKEFGQPKFDTPKKEGKKGGKK